MLRAQVAQKPAPADLGRADAPTSEPVVDRDGEARGTRRSRDRPRQGSRTRKPAACEGHGSEGGGQAEGDPQAGGDRRRGRRRDAAADARRDGRRAAPSPPRSRGRRASPRPRRRGDGRTGDGDAAPAAAPKRRTTRKVAAPAEPA